MNKPISRRTTRSVLTIAIVSVASIATSQTTQPASIESGSPRSALLEFNKTMHNGDGNSLHDLLLASNPTEEQIAKQIVDSATALAELTKNAADKFGPEAAHAAFGDPGAIVKMADENVAKSTETVTGDTAVVSLNRSGQGTMTLKKVDGKWKIAVGDLVKNVDPATLQKMMKSMDSGNAIVKQMAADIGSGKYPTADAAKTVLDDKINEVKAEAREASSTTKPG